jgi:hypothetical protein
LIIPDVCDSPEVVDEDTKAELNKYKKRVENKDPDAIASVD